MAIYKPYDYQKYAEDFLLEHEEAGLFLDMGLGKTVVTLTALSKLRLKGPRSIPGRKSSASGTT